MAPGDASVKESFAVRSLSIARVLSFGTKRSKVASAVEAFTVSSSFKSSSRIFGGIGTLLCSHSCASCPTTVGIEQRRAGVLAAARRAAATLGATVWSMERQRARKPR
jgi:ABC-type spermidine/putrescine transport system permease subunit II